MAVNERIEEQHQNFFLEGIKALHQTWQRRVDLRRNYGEK